MPAFVVVGHRAVTDGNFSLNDLPGSTGRLDILIRCVTASFFLSHGLRRNVETYLVLQGEPEPPKTLRFAGAELKYLNPDERSTASLIRTALMQNPGRENDGKREVQSTPGIYVSRGGLPETLEKMKEKPVFLLDENGENIRDKNIPEDAVFILGGQLDLTENEVELVMKLNPDVVSLGPKKLHASHCITVVLNHIDNIYD